MIGQNGNLLVFNYLYDMLSTIEKTGKQKLNSTKRLIYIGEFQELNSNYLEDKDRNVFFELYWVRNEKPLTFLENESLSVDVDRVHLIPPLRDYHFEKANKKGKLIAFHKDLLTLEAKEFSLSIYKLFGQNDTFSTLFIDKENFDTLDTLLTLLRDENNRDPENILLLRTLLKAFLIKLMNSTRQELMSPGINEKRLYHFLLLLEDYYTTEKNVNFYAEKLNLSAKRLNQILKQRIGKTINQVLQERTLTEAKHLLFIGKKSIKEIAYTLGFQDASYFSRFFKKMTKLSPDDFRNQTNNKLAFKKA